MSMVQQLARRRLPWLWPGPNSVGAGALPAWLPPVLIVVLQAVIALTTLRNTAFQDEGLYLYAGRQILRHWLGGPVPLENYAFYFSGYPYLYPVVGGTLDAIGGLELARGFSLACMLGVTVLVYVCTRKLFRVPAAIFAAAAYACLGTVLFVSRLATYDALCLLLIAMATATALQVGPARRSWPALTLGPLLTLAILAKYAALLFVPSVVGVLASYAVADQGWRRMPARLAMAVGSLLASLAVAYRVMDRSAFHAIAGSTTNRVAIVQKPRLEMFLHVLYLGGAVYTVALIGLGLVWLHHRRLRLLALVLFSASLLVPVYHIYKQEVISLDKHMAFSLLFAMPLAGCAIGWLAGEVREGLAVHPRGRLMAAARRRWMGEGYGLAGVAVVLIVLILGVHQSQNLYKEWANTSALRYVMHTQMRDGSGRYLVEDIEVVRYDDEDVAEPWQWNGPYYFYYVTSDHRQLLGDPALTQAIKDQYFVLVELSFVYQPYEAHFIAQQLAASRNYDLLTNVPFQGNLIGGGPLGNSYGRGCYYIWRSSLVKGRGNFTSLSQLAKPAKVKACGTSWR